MLLTSVQIKAADGLYMNERGISERELVLKAADAAYFAYEKHAGLPSGKRILVLCGRGLNGADGYALALLLGQNGASVFTCALYNDNICQTTLGLADECNAAGICNVGSYEAVLNNMSEYDVIIDAVFGIGFRGELDIAAKASFAAVAKSPAQKVALDVPSGVFADSADVADGAFNADITIALCAKKPCHLFYPARENCGVTYTADIGFGGDILNRINPYLFELKSHDFKTLLQKRDDFCHKGDFGCAGLIVGSLPYRGAAVLAVKAALRCGAGIVRAYIPDTIYGAFESDCFSAVVNPLKSKGGGIDDKSLSSRLDGCTALLCGSGLGLLDGAAAAVRDTAKTKLPVVFDGDALTVISHDLGLLKREGQTVLTPHMGEFARLCGKSVDEIRNHRITLSLQFAAEHKCVLILKDSVSIVALPDSRAFILSNPTSALSKGGSGDVLAGMVCSFLAQGYNPAAAAVIAVSLHNACAHAACDKLGCYCMLPEDVIKMLPMLLR